MSEAEKLYEYFGYDHSLLLVHAAKVCIVKSEDKGTQTTTYHFRDNSAISSCGNVAGYILIETPRKEAAQGE